MDVYFATRKNKRYGRDAMEYENSWLTNLVRALRDRDERTLRILHNTAFLTSVPRWREIMATSIHGRHLDHEICEVVIPTAEPVLSKYTFNNRKDKGAQAAMNQLIEHIYEVTECYTKPARIIKLDLKGYFPNARWDVACDEICKVIDLSDYPDKDYLKWLTMIAVHANPAAHCELRTPSYFWKEHIDPEKSILAKPEGVGAAIGRWIWQVAMGLYINDDIKWLTEECGLKAVCFRGRHCDCRPGAPAPIRARHHTAAAGEICKEGRAAERTEILRPISRARGGVPRLSHYAVQNTPQSRHGQTSVRKGGELERDLRQEMALRGDYGLRKFLYGTFEEPHRVEEYAISQGEDCPRLVGILGMGRAEAMRPLSARLHLERQDEREISLKTA